MEAIDNRAVEPNLRGSYRITRFVFLRALGAIYFVAFLSLAHQVVPLIGANGLLPARLHIAALIESAGTPATAFITEPTIFVFGHSDGALITFAYVGVGLALLVVVGFANAPLMAGLWLLYISFVHVGQLFWGYGWEILLLETGVLATFLCCPFDPRPSAVPRVPLPILMWLLRWIVFRLMFGAGLIKIHGDPCWRNLTCMMYHYETQPLPNPLSWYLHHLPPLLHRLEVLVNHFVELIVPWTMLAPRRIRQIGGLCFIGFQSWLILSGNLVWLNWLTIVLCIACFDDHAFAWLLPARGAAMRPASPASWSGSATVFAYAAVVAFLSIGPVGNLLGGHQIMNGSFDRLHLVNTYGAFGSVGKVRNEIILEGTTDEEISDATQWRTYEFKCKPGDLRRRPCVVAPYHYRIDWQIWFAAMEDPRANPWLVHLIYLLLHDDAGALSLLANNPFPDAPPRFIRAELYRYQFTAKGDPTGAWWQRTRIGEYFPPLSLDLPGLQRFIAARGWEYQE
ncbi:MAG TPA: lipase maturation factor family protein [Candidatus Binatia bacterium]|nr:lipase maturation factor family protein [Candidatus Binatia bacterium]